ncbi:glycosyltransferase family 2 protein [Halopseudomonas xinjiangensis]|nr:glycosyltransferase family 2 protein [Halopseudomonas xinjiangensis]
MAVMAVIVSFNPEASTFSQLLTQLSAQVERIVVVDNASTGDIASLVRAVPEATVDLLQATQNLGIAAAQNLGISKASESGCDAIIFFDQDSRIPDGVIARLKAHLCDPAVSIVAPVHFDAEQGFGYPVVDIAPNGTRRKWQPETLSSPIDVSVAISSGTLVRRGVFDQVGLMDESLFIDYVDTEWCLRCVQKGYFVRVEPAARLEHSLGLRSASLGRFRIPIHRPERRYYRIRNALLLVRYPHVPLLMALREVIFGFVHTCVIVLLVRHRQDYLRFYVKGVVDGVRGRSGPCSQRSSR